MNAEVKKFQEDARKQMADECAEMARVLLDENVNTNEQIELLIRHQFRLTFYMDCTKTFKILEEYENSIE